LSVIPEGNLLFQAATHPPNRLKSSGTRSL
jgi:hypothetical protein